MKPKRILFVDPVGEKGGAEVVLFDLVCGLDRTRYQPVVACLKPGPFVEELRELNVPAFALQAHKARQLHRVIAAIRQLVRIVRRERIDLLYGNGNTMLFYAGLAARLTKIPCVWHVYDPLSGRGAFERFFVTVQRRLHPAWTIFCSPITAESHLATYKQLKLSRIILPGVDVARLLEDTQPQRAREALGIPPSAPIVAMFSRLQRQKGHLDLIEAVARVLSRHPETRFVLCGGALFDLEADYPDELKRVIEQQGLQDRVLLTGYVSDTQKRDILAAATIVVHPAHSEPFGLAVIEGMAAGKPVVATDCVGPRMTIVHNETGLIVPRGDVQALVSALCALLDDPERAGLLGRCGQRRVQDNFTVQAMVQQVEDVCDQVLSRFYCG